MNAVIDDRLPSPGRACSATAHVRAENLNLRRASQVDAPGVTPSVNYAAIGQADQSEDLTYTAIGGLDLRRASEVEAPSSAAGGDVMYASIAKVPPPQPGKDYEVQESTPWCRSVSDAAGSAPVSRRTHPRALTHTHGCNRKHAWLWYCICADVVLGMCRRGSKVAALCELYGAVLVSFFFAILTRIVFAASCTWRFDLV